MKPLLPLALLLAFPCAGLARPSYDNTLDMRLAEGFVPARKAYFKGEVPLFCVMRPGYAAGDPPVLVVQDLPRGRNVESAGKTVVPGGARGEAQLAGLSAAGRGAATRYLLNGATAYWGLQAEDGGQELLVVHFKVEERALKAVCRSVHSLACWEMIGSIKPLPKKRPLWMRILLEEPGTEKYVKGLRKPPKP